MTPLGRVAAWTSAPLFAAIAARVFTGEMDAPAVVLLAIVGPFVAALRRDDRLPPGRAGTLAAVGGLMLALCASMRVVADGAVVHGLGRSAATVAVLGLALAVGAVRATSARRSGGGLVALAVASATASAVVVGVLAGTAPWTAWTAAASRPAVVFAEHGAATTDGRAVAVATTVAFAELHRVTALSPDVRVLRGDGGGRHGHERRIDRGQSVTLQPGDRLALGAGSRIRFEDGKRVPGSLVSGVAWADPQRRRTAGAGAELVGLALTMLGGACALLPPVARPRRRDAILIPLLIGTFTVAAAVWGVYTMYRAPDLLVATTLLTPLVELPPLLGGRGDLLAGAVGVTLVALFVGTAGALADRVATIVSGAPARTAARPGAALVAWGGACAAAAAIALSSVDAWRVLGWGLGLLASGWIAPALATSRGRAAGAASVAGTLVFGAVAALGAVGALPASLGPYPALVAAPVAWGAARWFTRPVTRRR
jgi:hypothetical protein